MKKNRSCVRNLMAVLLSIMALVSLTGCAEDKEASVGGEASVVDTTEPTEINEAVEDEKVAEAVAEVDPTEAPTPTEEPSPTEAPVEEETPYIIDGIDFFKYLNGKETMEAFFERMNYDSPRVVVFAYTPDSKRADIKDGEYAILKDGDIYDVGVKTPLLM